jgi:hypothetical protein
MKAAGSSQGRRLKPRPPGATKGSRIGIFMAVQDLGFTKIESRLPPRFNAKDVAGLII